jgi:hypothetical protein
LTAGSLLQLIILIVAIRNINKNNEAPIYIRCIIFKFELNRLHPALSKHTQGNGKTQQQQKHMILYNLLINKITE